MSFTLFLLLLLRLKQTPAGLSALLVGNFQVTHWTPGRINLPSILGEVCCWPCFSGVRIRLVGVVQPRGVGTAWWSVVQVPCGEAGCTLCWLFSLVSFRLVSSRPRCGNECEAANRSGFFCWFLWDWLAG